VVVPVRTTRGFEADAARALFDARIREANNEMDYDVSRDGQRFLINERLAVPNVFNVISNWRGAPQP